MTESRSTLRGRDRQLIAGAALVTTLIAACSSAGGSAASAVPSGSATAAGGATTTDGRVSANTASQDEIRDALTSAGVSNAARWADEVLEYRPYPADDPTLQKLQDNLAKYNPDPETLQGILSALKP